jgi:pimeloyl-ACP methyl ester carboxylesterase
MYPEKVGRLVIDGVYDANDYRTTQWQSNLEDTDAVIFSFFEFCHQAGPLKCPLYAHTVAEIQQRVNTIVETLSSAPIPIPFLSKGPVVLTKKMFDMLVFTSAYSPLTMFKVIADGLVAIETYNLTTLANITETFLDTPVECNCKETTPWLASTEAFYAIACGDGDEVPDGPGDYDAYFAKLAAKSSFASQMWGIHRLQCAQWKIRPKSRFVGPLAGNTSHPLLILSPSFDPVCPLKDAQAVQRRYTGSALLVQNSYGHCSLASPSLCTAKHLRAYFTKGTLPKDGTVCEVEELPFVGDTGGMDTLSSQDMELLEALRALTSEVPKFGLS